MKRKIRKKKKIETLVPQFLNRVSLDVKVTSPQMEK